MKETTHKLEEIFEAIERLDENSEGLLLGGFAIISGGNGGVSPLGNENCNCNCSCESNGNCDCNCGGCTNNGNCTKTCGPTTTKATSGSHGVTGFTFSF